MWFLKKWKEIVLTEFLISVMIDFSNLNISMKYFNKLFYNKIQSVTKIQKHLRPDLLKNDNKLNYR